MSKIINSLDEVLEIFRQTFDLSKEQMAWILQDRALDLLIIKAPFIEDNENAKYSFAFNHDGSKVGHDYSSKEAYLVPKSKNSPYAIEHRKLNQLHNIYGPSINDVYAVHGSNLSSRAILVFKDMVKKLEQ